MSHGRTFGGWNHLRGAASLVLAATLGGCIGDIGTPGPPIRPGLPDGRPAGDGPAAGDPGGHSLAEPTGSAAPTATRVRSAAPRWARLTAEEVRSTIADLFGDVAVGPLDPDLRVDGFARVGGAAVATSQQGVERYTNAAFAIGEQVMKDPARRGRWVFCDPTGAALRGCAGKTFARLGRLLFRRPVEAETLAGLVDVAASVARETGDAWTGFGHALAAMLQSPRFLYTLELPASAAAPGRPARLDGHSLATRLALFLTGGNPDESLLDAAAAGGLGTDAGVAAEAERLMRTPQHRRAVRRFFAAMWSIEQVATRPFDDRLARATPTIGASMLEETMRFLEHHLIDGAADYRAALTSPVTVLNKELAALYGLPPPKGAGADGFALVALPPGARRFGVLTQGALLAATSSPTESSPILRGRMIQEGFLCRPIPPPPPDLMVSLPPAPKGKPMTKRQRLAVHREAPDCAACHAAMDPPGLALENYDALGAYRETENGLPIDPGGALDGVAWKDAGAFATALASHPAVTTCLVTKLFRNATGRVESDDEMAHVAGLEAAFERAGRRLGPLFTALSTSEAFTHVTLATN